MEINKKANIEGNKAESGKNKEEDNIRVAEKAEDITFSPIGVIRTPYDNRSETPKAGAEAPDVEGRIEIYPQYEEGLRDIKRGDRLMVLFNFHKSDRKPLVVKLRGVGPDTGVFSTHSPDRPNAIGVSVIDVLERDGCTIRFTGVDMVDGTPVLDIKNHNV